MVSITVACYLEALALDSYNMRIFHGLHLAKKATVGCVAVNFHHTMLYVHPAVVVVPVRVNIARPADMHQSN